MIRWNCLSKYFSSDDINLYDIGILKFEFINIKSALYNEAVRDPTDSPHMNVICRPVSQPQSSDPSHPEASSLASWQEVRKGQHRDKKNLNEIKLSCLQSKQWSALVSLHDFYTLCTYKTFTLSKKYTSLDNGTKHQFREKQCSTWNIWTEALPLLLYSCVALLRSLDMSGTQLSHIMWGGLVTKHLTFNNQAFVV